VVLVVVIVIIVAVVATSGGGGSPTAVPTTTRSATPVIPSPTPSGTPTTTTPQSSTPSLNVTIPAGGNLSAGDSGDQVLTLQKALKQLGLDVGTPDGKFGQKTQDAVKAFQTAHSLTPDGVVGNDTAQAINDALASSAG
jgi:peptidoglycan hydrolase-like protein with peptidoglycan-binding domain